MSKGFKFGQVVGIIVGVIAGSMLINAILAPRKTVVYVQPVNMQPVQPMQPLDQKGVFEQALSINPQVKWNVWLNCIICLLFYWICSLLI